MENLIFVETQTFFSFILACPMTPSLWHFSLVADEGNLKGVQLSHLAAQLSRSTHASTQHTPPLKTRRLSTRAFFQHTRVRANLSATHAAHTHTYNTHTHASAPNFLPHASLSSAAHTHFRISALSELCVWCQ